MNADIERHLPAPSGANPHVQVEYIFKRCSEELKAGPGYGTCLRRYKEFLSERYGSDEHIHVRHAWDERSVEDFKQWLKTQRTYSANRQLTAGTQSQLLYMLGRVMRYAYDERYIDILPIASPDSAHGRETTMRNAYSRDEEANLMNALAPEIRYANRVAQSYVRTGVGTSPESSAQICEDDLIYFFENTLKCVAIQPKKFYKKYRDIALAIAKKYGAIEKWYEKLGVSELISMRLVIPLVYKLAWETGLNVESILDLRRDCFVEKHPLTAMPCIQYYKERGKGDALYPVALLEVNLQSKQSTIVKNTIKQILRLTEVLVKNADGVDKEMLLLVQRKQDTKGRGAVTRLNATHLTRWSASFFTPNVKHRNPFNSEENINVSRLRPTFVTRLVMEGRDIFEISALLNHSDIYTTLAYLDRHRLTPQFEEEMRKHLNQIKENSKKYRNVIPITAEVTGADDSAFLASGLCHCKNPFQPPRKIQLASKFVPGKVCTYYDMCLLCKNILVTEYSLPKLINYRLNLRCEIEKGVGAEPRKNLYRRQLYVLDEILAPDELFTEEEIARATVLAKSCIDDHFDDFLFG
ncbi:site-specific integrase [Paraburkholderia nodosa]|uniref:site-specific integrase n=1 Tax=Paraburkholderia nodosa TaxID=392320 RepID=UPI0004AE1232|nr:site-specific integrase [Paraburkholderia nodosa]